MYTEGLGAQPSVSSLTKNLFAPNTSNLNPERIAQNAALEERALAGDAAAWLTLQTRARPGVLPYKEATDDAKARVNRVKSQLGNRTQSGGAVSPVTAGVGNVLAAATSSPAILASVGLIALAFILRER